MEVSLLQLKLQQGFLRDPNSFLWPKQSESRLLLLLVRFSYVRLFATLWTIAHWTPLSMGFSRQEPWSRLPLPSPMHESEKWKWSRSVVSDSLWPHGLLPARLLRPWDFPGKSTGVGCQCLVWKQVGPPFLAEFRYLNSPQPSWEGRIFQITTEEQRFNIPIIPWGKTC